MCGIVGYVGRHEAAPFLVLGLKSLEYRGYDSAGVAVHDGRRVRVVRALGKLACLEASLAAEPASGTTGIGHTRWATHGRPSTENAHPHVAGDVAVVHNGIIENHAALRARLSADGVRFSSDTDTEIVAHLVARALRREGTSLLSAVQTALADVRGAYALAVVAGHAPGVVVIAKRQSPLVVGVGEGEMLCASDVPALLSRTRDVILLEDGDVAELREGGVRIFAEDGREVERRRRRVQGSAATAARGSFKHFMQKEIHEQPDAIASALRGRIDLSRGVVRAEDLGLPEGALRQVERVALLACGTSHHASMAGRYWIERLARTAASTELASEVRDRDPVFGDRDLVIAVSQSGETADTLAAVRAARRRGARVLAVTNVVESAIAREADFAAYTHAGPEIGVASTKCFTTQLAVLLLIAIELGLEHGTLPPERARALLSGLVEVPSLVRRTLALATDVPDVARRVGRARDVLFLGRGLGHPVALEGALKLKEISYVHAEGYAAGEMKHGPIALVDEGMPVVAIAPRDACHAKVLSNMAEVRARGAYVVAIGTEGDDELASAADRVIPIPAAADDLLPLLTVIPTQLLAYHVADFKGTDVDQPRNLAKTVTVE